MMTTTSHEMCMISLKELPLYIFQDTIRFLVIVPISQGNRGNYIYDLVVYYNVMEEQHLHLHI